MRDKSSPDGMICATVAVNYDNRHRQAQLCRNKPISLISYFDDFSHADDQPAVDTEAFLKPTLERACFF